ncbi:YjaG family protein [Ferrimonas balearica]|uniref:YjaG family protein n=1 Tax=Ferrimonas balearica TaxID=44012 RepID=UPI001F290981|nr:YjaG family protein [Ferrimonas balearica]MBY6094384.1 YjaG family protein [Ferrimonas balearica]
MTARQGFFSRIKALDLWQKTLFATALAERMLPNYLLFAELTEAEEADKVVTQLDMLWQSLYSKDIRLNYERMLNQLEERMPDPQVHDFYGVYPASDALMAISTILTALQQKVEADLVNISKLSSSTVAAFIEATEQPEIEDDDALDEFVFSHPLMQEERGLQSELLTLVETLSRKDVDAIKGLRKELREEGVSNIGVSLSEE